MFALTRALAVVCLALIVALAAACGGGSPGTKAPNQAKIPTATLPATLPEPQILGQAVAQPGGGSTYTVKSGDTLAGIASRFGVSLEDLRAANANIDASSLSVGQTIRLPQDASPPAAGATSEPPPPEPPTAVPPTVGIANTPLPPENTPVPAPTATTASLGQTYTVQQGDIPVSIAAKFGITVEALLAANPGINPNNLHIGDVLVIPPKPPA